MSRIAPSWNLQTIRALGTKDVSLGRLGSGIAIGMCMCQVIDGLVGCSTGSPSLNTSKASLARLNLRNASCFSKSLACCSLHTPAKLQYGSLELANV